MKSIKFTATALALAVSFGLADKPDSDLAAAFLDPETWRESVLPLPGQWQPISIQSADKVLQLREPGPVFGAVPQQIQAFFDQDRLKRVEIVFLEAGLFFGPRLSRVIENKIATSADPKERAALSRQLREQKKTEDEERKASRKEFEQRFNELEKSVPAAIAAATGAAGRRAMAGSHISSRVTQYATNGIEVRFLAEDQMLVAVHIMPEESAGRSMLEAAGGAGQRRAAARQNAVRLDNGDVVIADIPMSRQGNRGYCAMGTLAMILQYYGLNAGIDVLAAKAGYKEGEWPGQKVLAVYEAAAKEAKLKLRKSQNLNFEQVQDLITKGKPILVWRFFSVERDRFHSEFARRFQQDPAAELPDPKRDKADRASWPTRESGGHASLVTGFNKDRREILFTESWGEGNRNRRMRAEELEATLYHAFIFEP